jgi:nitrate/nitrite transport system permease protein
MKSRYESLAAAALSLFFLFVLVGMWHLATLPKAEVQGANDEYARLMGKGAKKVEGFPTPGMLGETALKHLSDPFYDKGSNDKGIGIQLAHSLGRVGMGYLLAMLVAIPLGFVIGMSPLMYRALDPFIQVLKPISPLAWMPIALYTIKDSSISGVFVIFICSIWPMLINTAYGVASVRRDWLNVAKTLEVKPLRRAFQVTCPPRHRPSLRGCAYQWESRGS